MNEDMPWVNLTQEEVEELRNKKHELTEYGKQRLRELMNKDKDLIFYTNGKETSRIPSPTLENLTLGTKAPETKLEIKMTETDISKVLIEGEYATIMGVKYKRVEEPKKPETLYGIIADWWDEIFLNNNEAAETIESLVDRIEKEWLPKEQSAAGSQNVYVECSVEGFNDCLTKIKGKLR